MKVICKHVVLMAVICLIGLGGNVYAQSGDAVSQEQEMKQMLDMLKNSGMDPKQLQQMEDILKGVEEQGNKQMSAKLKKAQQKFEAETAGHGTAQVEVEGKMYELKMIECKITDRNAGHFSMHAQQMPGTEKGELWVGGGGGHLGNTIRFSLNKYGFNEASGNPTFQLNGKMLEWEGMVEGDAGKVPLKIHVTCGAEMVDYATPSQPNPASSENVLTLHIGKEPQTFQAGRCSTKEYRTGNLIVEFEATATGTFRGRPAIVLLSKSHPVDSKQTFQNMDLLLGELTPEQRTFSPLKVAEQLQQKVDTFTSTETIAVQKKYEEKIGAYQKHFDKEMPDLKKQYGANVPQAKMAELMDPFNTLMDAQVKEMDKVQEQAKAMQYPKGRSFGAITVNGKEVHFGGSKLSPTHNREAPEFQNLPEKTELWVTCGG